MEDDLKNTNIQITSAEDTGQQIKIRDQNRRTYSFFKIKKDGGETAAFKNYQHFKIGDSVEISYKEVPYKDSTIKSIMNIKPATAPVEQTPYMRGERMLMKRGLGREYWEAREEKRQSSILMQVAFKAAIALQVARVESGDSENREKLYADALDFYDWITDQIGDGIEHDQSEPDQTRRETGGQEQLEASEVEANEEIGF